jgi:flagellar protein FliS
MYESARDAYLESRVLSATPLELVQLLYQGAIRAVQDARQYLEEGAIAPRSRAISKAHAILTELRHSLNRNEGGELAARLAALYDYMQRRLLEANCQKTDPPLCEVLGLLTTMAEGWTAIAKPAEQSPVSAGPWSQMEGDGSHSYGSSGWSLQG